KATMPRQRPGRRARAARSMMASEAQRWAVTMSGAKRWYSSRSASASMKSTFPTWACSARRRASLIAAGSLSRPTTCRARAASQKVSRPVPQPTSSPRIAPRPSASSSPRNLGEMGKLLGLEVLRLWVMDGEGRGGVRAQILRSFLPPLRECADALATGHGEKRHVVRLRRRIPYIVRETEPLAGPLTGEGEARGLAPIARQDEILARRARLEEAVEGVGLQPPLLYDLALQLLDHRVDLEGLRVSLGEQPLDRAPHAQMLAEEPLA